MDKISISKDSLQDLIWMSMRYCVGRKTIAAYMHTNTIGSIIHHNSKIFDQNDRKHLSNLINQEITNVFGWNKFVDLQGSNLNSNFDAYTYALLESSKHPEDTKLVIDLSIGALVKTEPIDFNKQSYEKLDADYSDLIGWVKLMRALHPKYHKKVSHEYTDIESGVKISGEDICISFPIKKDGKYVEVYQPVERVLIDGTRNWHINPAYIKSIK